MENELLHKEVDRLQSLLSSKGTPLTLPIIKQHLSLEEKVDVFRNLFKGREDVFARRWYSRTSGKSGYQPVCQNEWDWLLCPVDVRMRSLPFWKVIKSTTVWKTRPIMEKNIAVAFKGQLREEQRAAIASLTAHDNVSSGSHVFW